jgi:prophage antirepressor-like protein
MFTNANTKNVNCIKGVKLKMNNLQVFNYSDKQVRTLLKDGQPWWVLKDITEILEIERGTRIVDRLDEDEVRLT